MSEILTYTDGFTADAQITKMTTFNSKGGGLTLQVQLPLDAALAGTIAMHLGNIAKIEVKFSSAKAPDADADPSQLTLDDLEEDE